MTRPGNELEWTGKVLKMKNLSEADAQHLIDMHEEAIAQLKLLVKDRPQEPESPMEAFPPVVMFLRPIPGLTQDDPTVDTPFVAIRYSTGSWYCNRGGGAPSGPFSWDSLLDWIGATNWHTITPMRRQTRPQSVSDASEAIRIPKSDLG